MQNRQFTCNTIYLSEKKIHCIEGSYSAITGITDYLVLAFPAFVLITEKFSLAKLP